MLARLGYPNRPPKTAELEPDKDVSIPVFLGFMAVTAALYAADIAKNTINNIIGKD